MVHSSRTWMDTGMNSYTEPQVWHLRQADHKQGQQKETLQKYSIISFKKSGRKKYKNVALFSKWSYHLIYMFQNKDLAYMYFYVCNKYQHVTFLKKKKTRAIQAWKGHMGNE